MRPLVLFSVLTIGCANPRAPAPVAPPKLAPVVSNDWRTFAYPTADSYARRIERDDKGIERILMGGLRAEIDKGAVAFSDDGLLDRITVSCHSESGWLHIASAGYVFWSETFLGALKPVGVLDSGDQTRQCGPVVVINNAAGVPVMWSRSGARPLPAAKELAQIRFSSPLDARAIASPDRLLQSDDGGGSFHETAYRARDFKTPSDWLGRDPHRERSDVEQSTMERLLAAYAHHSVESNAGAQAGGIRLKDGAWVRDAVGDWRQPWFDNKGGRGSSITQYISIRRPDGGVVDTHIDGKCQLFPWGNRLIRGNCEGSDSDLQVVYPFDAPRIPKPPQYARRIFADPSGHYILADVDYDSQDKDSEHTLMQFDGTEWHVYRHVNGAPIAMSEKWLLLCGRTCRLVPLWNPEASGMSVTLDSHSASTIQLLDDAVVYLRESTGHGDESKVELVHRAIGPSGLSRESTHSMARETRWIAFADRLHGVAGDTDKRVYTTNDGGSSWTPVEGAKRDLEYPESSTKCWSDGCSIAGAVAFTNRSIERLVTADFGHVLPAPRAAQPVPERPYGSHFETTIDKAVRWRYDIYACRSHPKAPQQALAPELPDPPARGSKADEDERFHSNRLPTHGGVFEKLKAPQRFGWHGQDAQGTYSVRTPALKGEGIRIWKSFNDLSGHVDSGVRFATRHFVVIVEPTQIVTLHEDGRLEQLAAAPSLWGRGLAFPDGTAIVQAEYPDSELERNGYLEVMALDAYGKRTEKRWFALQSAFMASGPSGPGIVVPDGNTLKYFSLNPGMEPVTFPAPNSIPVCTGAPKGNALLFFGLSPALLIDDKHDPPVSIADGLVEMRDDGACLRGIRAGTLYALTIDAVNGALRGTLIGPKTTHNVTCAHASRALPQ